MSEEANAQAVVAALSALSAEPLELDDVPTPPPAFYTEVTVTRRFGGVVRGETPSTTLYRITTRAVAQTVTNAREMRRRAALIEGTSIAVGGVHSTPIQFETDEPIGPDSGWYSGLTSWTYAI